MINCTETEYMTIEKRKGEERRSGNPTRSLVERRRLNVEEWTEQDARSGDERRERDRRKQTERRNNEAD